MLRVKWACRQGGEKLEGRGVLVGLGGSDAGEMLRKLLRFLGPLGRT